MLGFRFVSQTFTGSWRIACCLSSLWLPTVAQSADAHPTLAGYYGDWKGLYTDEYPVHLTISQNADRRLSPIDANGQLTIAGGPLASTSTFALFHSHESLFLVPGTWPRLLPEWTYTANGQSDGSTRFQRFSRVASEDEFILQGEELILGPIRADNSFVLTVARHARLCYEGGQQGFNHCAEPVRQHYVMQRSGPSE